jgi:cell division septation protein DedD
MDVNRRQTGWVSTIAALVVLVVVGFLCGALAGFLWEEPGLVFAYLSGKTQPVDWSTPEKAKDVAAPAPTYSGSAELPSEPEAKSDLAGAAVELPSAPAPAAAGAPVAAPAAVPASAPARPVEKVEKKPAPPAPVAAVKPAAIKPAPAKVAAATPAGRFSVQVGAFADRASADKLVSQLKGHGFTTYVKADGEGSLKRFRVRVGPVTGRPRAEELVAKLKGEKLSGWIVDESKG